MPENDKANDATLDALDFVVRALNQHEKQIDKLISKIDIKKIELSKHTEELNASLDEISKKIDALKNKIEKLKTSLQI
jgi:chromosome segregation ATPase